MYCDRCGTDNRDEARFCKSCGADLAEQRTDYDAPYNSTPAPTTPVSQEDQVGRVVGGRYLVHSEIGRGGMGIVYKAMDQELERPVALKVLHPRIAKRPEAVKQLREEALASMKITHHNIVRLYNFENTPEAVYLLMEYVPGQSLAKMLSNGLAAGFTERDVVRIAQQVCDALIAAHKAGVIHRDIKPSNVLITPEGQVKIVDLGIAAAHEPTRWGGAAGSSAGTPTYMAPEQFERRRVDGRTDVYALGATLYEVLASHPPFVGGDLKQQHLHTPPEPIPGVSDWLNEIVLKCLAKSPKDRFVDAKALRKALDGSAEDGVRAMRKTDIEPEWRRVARERERRERMLRDERGESPPPEPDPPKVERIQSPTPPAAQVVKPQRPGALPPAGPVTPFSSGIEVAIPGGSLPGGGGSAAYTVTSRTSHTTRQYRDPRLETTSTMHWRIPEGVLQFATGSAMFATLAALGIAYWQGRSGVSTVTILLSQVGLAGVIGLFWGMAEREARDLLMLILVGLGAGLAVGMLYLVQKVTPETPPLTLLGVEVARGLVLGGVLGAALGAARRSPLAAGIAGAMGAGGALLAALLQTVARLQGVFPSPLIDSVGGAFVLAFLLSSGAAIGASAVRVPKDQQMRL